MDRARPGTEPFIPRVGSVARLTSTAPPLDLGAPRSVTGPFVRWREAFALAFAIDRAGVDPGAIARARPELTRDRARSSIDLVLRRSLCCNASPLPSRQTCTQKRDDNLAPCALICALIFSRRARARELRDERVATNASRESRRVWSPRESSSVRGVAIEITRPNDRTMKIRAPGRARRGRRSRGGRSREGMARQFGRSSNQRRAGRVGAAAARKSEMARSERFELPTPRFEVWCSIRLSYEREGATIQRPRAFATISRDRDGNPLFFKWMAWGRRRGGLAARSVFLNEIPTQSAHIVEKLEERPRVAT